MKCSICNLPLTDGVRYDWTYVCNTCAIFICTDPQDIIIEYSYCGLKKYSLYGSKITNETIIWIPGPWSYKTEVMNISYIDPEIIDDKPQLPLLLDRLCKLKGFL